MKKVESATNITCLRSVDDNNIGSVDVTWTLNIKPIPLAMQPYRTMLFDDDNNTNNVDL